MVARTFGTNIAEQSSTLGVAAYQLDGPLMGFRAFSSDFVTSDTPYYAVKNSDESKYEYNKGVTTFTHATPDTLLRAPWLSSNANAAVSWAAEDLPLIVYIPTAAELFEFMVKSWLATTRNAVITFGKWWKLNTPSSGIHQETMYDGTTDIPIAEVDTTTHKYHGYGTSKVTRVQVGTMVQLATPAIFPADNTIPQNTEGVAMPSAYDCVVPIESATSTIRLRALIHCADDNESEHFHLAAFVDSNANALAMGEVTQQTAWEIQLRIDAQIANPGVGSHTYKLRISKGSTASGSITLNGRGGIALYGGVIFSHIEIEERF